MEQFIDIKGYKGFYQISNLGRVKALSKKLKNGTGYAIRKEKFLIPAEKDNKYLFVYLSKSGVKHAFYIHRLVALHFIPNPENKPHVNHKNCDKSDNRYFCLEWVTRSENILHSYKNGIHKPMNGTLSPKAKLNERQVKQIKNRYKNGGMSFRKLADAYGVHHSIIDGIMQGKRWSHVKQ